ncbi:hypothetical protein [uncultured Ilyobacter sp.]|uniref:hypothetical protein n=1 Tax=uncultured Ilyobacter sp. TaxID=544433 RepID=UPI0029C8FE64|nr:hypothetical protein [uncultured Ilyobacter sp.]
MLNRVMVTLDNEAEVEHLARYGKMIIENYPNVEIVGVYIQPGIEEYSYGAGVDYDIKGGKIDHELKIKKAMETEEKIKEKFLSLFENYKFYSKTGDMSEVFLNELKLFDLAIISKTDKINHNLKEILKKHHKPIILVPDLDKFSLDKILIADDQGLEVNKSVFDFINAFEKVKEFKAITVNISQESVKDLTFYLEKIEKKIEYIFEEGPVDEIILDCAKEFDMLVLGNLKHSFLVEKLIGEAGVKIIEKIKKPVFIA